MKRKVKLIGIGSPLVEYPLGCQLVHELEQQTVLQVFKSQLDFIMVENPGIDFLELMQGAELVYLFDAVVSKRPFASIVHFEGMEIAQQFSELSSQGYALAQALHLGHALSILPNKISFYGIEINNSNFVKQKVQYLINAQLILLKQVIAELRAKLYD